VLLRFLGRRPSDGGLSLCKVGARAGGPAGAFGCAIGPAVRRRRDFPCRFRGVSGLFWKSFVFIFGVPKRIFGVLHPGVFLGLAFFCGNGHVGIAPPAGGGHDSGCAGLDSLSQGPENGSESVRSPPLLAPVPLKRNPSRLCRAFFALSADFSDVDVADASRAAVGKRAAALAAVSKAFRDSLATMLPGVDVKPICDTVVAAWKAELQGTVPQTLRDSLLLMAADDAEFVAALHLAMYAPRRALAARCLAWRSARFSQAVAPRTGPSRHSRCPRRTCGGRYGRMPEPSRSGIEGVSLGRRPWQVEGSVCIGTGRSTTDCASASPRTGFGETTYPSSYSSLSTEISSALGRQLYVCV